MNDQSESLRDPFGPERSVRFDASGDLEICGYDVGEVQDLLTVYREHLRAVGMLSVEMNSGADAVRYVPEGAPQ